MLTSPLVFLALLAATVGLLLVAGRWLAQHRSALWRRTDQTWQRLRATAFLRSLARRFPGVWGFVRRRMSPEGYLGVHLTVGLLASLVALVAFNQLAEAVVGQDDITRFDLALANALHGAATPLGLVVFRTFTWFGSFPVMLLLGLVVGVILLGRGQWRILLAWVLGLAGGSVLNLVLKSVFQRPRPQFTDPFVVAGGWSFPSGHAMGSLIGYGLLAYMLLRSIQRHGARRLLMLGTAALILTIGFSRLYLGVHYFSDVIGGYAAGSVWLGVCVSGLETVRRRKRVRS